MSISNSILAIRDYFKSLADSHSLIKDFYFGGSERILNRERTSVDYPLVWLEVPGFTSDLSTPSEVMMDCAFAVLSNAVPDDWEYENTTIEDTYQIAQQFIRRLKDEFNEGDIEIDGDFATDFIDNWSADNDIGWRVEFRLKLPEGCYIFDKDKWLDTENQDIVSDDFDNVLTDDFGNVVSNS